MLIAYPGGSQAWVWQGRLVFGAYATEVAEVDRIVLAMLRAELDASGAPG